MSDCFCESQKKILREVSVVAFQWSMGLFVWQLFGSQRSSKYLISSCRRKKLTYCLYLLVWCFKVLLMHTCRSSSRTIRPHFTCLVLSSVSIWSLIFKGKKHLITSRPLRTVSLIHSPKPQKNKNVWGPRVNLLLSRSRLIFSWYCLNAFCISRMDFLVTLWSISVLIKQLSLFLEMKYLKGSSLTNSIICFYIKKFH